MAFSAKSAVVAGTFLMFSSIASAAPARDLCDHLADIYSSCGQVFHYDGRDFTFDSRGGTQTVTCDDGKNLDFYDRMDDMDMASIFMIPYLPGISKLPEVRRNWDPGRLRSEDLFKSVYGHNAAEVKKNLVKVSFLDQTVLFQKNLGAAIALEAVGHDLSRAAANDPKLAKFLRPFLTGRIRLDDMTFNWRVIAGTHRLSAHSFGTAIDLLTGVGPEYWLWDEKKIHPERAAKGEAAYKNIHYVPAAAPIFNERAVEIFESHGFIWGGKWNHYDSMHFEYRPELIQGVQITCS